MAEKNATPLRHSRSPARAADAGNPAPGGVAAVRKSLRLIEAVAQRGGATARELSEDMAVPLPTVYRLAHNLVENEYLVHLGPARRYELGYKLHALAEALHRQVAVPDPVARAVDALHRETHSAGYFALYRGADIVLAYVSDCAAHPRIPALDFGFHEAGHATAFGKILLAGMTLERRNRYLRSHPLTRWTPRTITSRSRLEAELDRVRTLGIAVEEGEFAAGSLCAAVPVRDGAGAVTGAVAISASTARLPHCTPGIEHRLRRCAAEAARSRQAVPEAGVAACRRAG